MVMLSAYENVAGGYNAGWGSISTALLESSSTHLVMDMSMLFLY